MIRIMTSNIWGDYFGNEVQVREDQLLAIYTQYAPDVVGMQEVTPAWHASTLMTGMENAGYLLLDNAPAGINNYNAMFVNTARFTVRKSGFEQMTHTEDASKNIQWAVLIDKESEKRIAVCNAHFEYRHGPQYDEAREFNAEQIVWRLRFLKEKYGCVAAFAFGDMNTDTESTVFSVYKKRGLTPLIKQADVLLTFSTYHGYPVRGEDGLFHGKTTKRPYNESLDHIVGMGEYCVKDYRIITDQPALDATDHSPVFADVET